MHKPVTANDRSRYGFHDNQEAYTAASKKLIIIYLKKVVKIIYKIILYTHKKKVVNI